MGALTLTYLKHIFWRLAVSSGGTFTLLWCKERSCGRGVVMLSVLLCPEDAVTLESLLFLWLLYLMFLFSVVCLTYLERIFWCPAMSSGGTFALLWCKERSCDCCFILLRCYVECLVLSGRCNHIGVLVVFMAVASGVVKMLYVFRRRVGSYCGQGGRGDRCTVYGWLEVWWIVIAG